MNRENWFLVLPTIVLGVVASYTLYQMHAAGDVRRAIEIVAEYEAEGQPVLAEYLGRMGPLEWDSEVVSNFYGTMDVRCTVGSTTGLRLMCGVSTCCRRLSHPPTRRRAS